MLMMNYASFCLIIKWTFFLVRPLLPTHCRCRELMLHLITTHTRAHTDTHTVWLPVRGIGPSQRPLPDNAQNSHSQESDYCGAGVIRTHNSSDRAAAVSRLRPRGHWDRHKPNITNLKPQIKQNFQATFSKQNIAMRQKRTVCSVSLNRQFVV